MTEYQHQSALFQWASYHWWSPYFLSIPNEQLSGPQHLGKLKKMGLKPGAPDTFLALPSNAYHGLFLELKAPNKKPTAKQIAMLTLLSQKGYYATWSDNLDKSIKILSDYVLLLKKHTLSEVGTDMLSASRPGF